MPVIPAEAGIWLPPLACLEEIPAFAGMTTLRGVRSPGEYLNPPLRVVDVERLCRRVIIVRSLDARPRDNGKTSKSNQKWYRSFQRSCLMQRIFQVGTHSIKLWRP